jgi:hypothetical protein
LKNIKPIQGYKAMALLGDAKIFDADLVRAARLAGLTAPRSEGQFQTQLHDAVAFRADQGIACGRRRA